MQLLSVFSFVLLVFVIICSFISIIFWMADKKMKKEQKNREQYFLNSIIKQKANNQN